MTANCLPLAKYGVNVLDVGTGPGPSAFAIHDFYSAVTQFSEHSGNRKWRQPVLVYCVEKARSTNHLRHLLGEMVYVLSQRQSMNVLAMTRHIPDFSQILPNQQRKALQKALNSTEDEYAYDTNSELSSELWFWAHVSNFKAQSLHRIAFLYSATFLLTSMNWPTLSPTCRNLSRFQTRNGPYATRWEGRKLSSDIRHCGPVS